MMRRIFLSVLLPLLPLTAHSNSLGYTDFTLDTDIVQLQYTYPSSGHRYIKGQLMEDFGFMESGQALYQVYPAWVDQDGGKHERHVMGALSPSDLKGTAQYALKMSKDESHHHIYYVDLYMVDDAVSHLRISFEKPYEYVLDPSDDWETQTRERYPPCDPILSDLSRDLGPVKRTNDWVEEALFHKLHFWEQNRRKIELDCAQPNDQGESLAISLKVYRDGSAN